MQTCKAQSGRTSAKHCSFEVVLWGHGTPCLRHWYTEQIVATPQAPAVGVMLGSRKRALSMSSEQHLKRSHAWQHLCSNRNTLWVDMIVATIAWLTKNRKFVRPHCCSTNRDSGLPRDSEGVHAFCWHKVLSRFLEMQKATQVCVATEALCCRTFVTSDRYA